MNAVLPMDAVLPMEVVALNSTETIPKPRFQAKIKVIVFSASKIDTATQQFSAHARFLLCWAEEGAHTESSNDPGLRVLNATTAEDMRESVSVQFISLDGRALYCQVGDGCSWFRKEYSFEGSCYQTMELRAFPFDAHFLTIRVRGTMEHAPYYITAHSMSRFENGKPPPDWILAMGPIPEPSCISRGHQHRIWYDLHFKLTAVRRYQSYVWNMYFVAFLVSGLAFTTVAVDPVKFADRCSITIGLLLTIVALKFVISDQLPKLAYLTHLDYYLLSAVVWICAVICENFVLAMKSRKSGESVVEIDEHYLSIMSILYCAQNTCICAELLYRKGCKAALAGLGIEGSWAKKHS
jgi:hypothetical protein